MDQTTSIKFKDGQNWVNIDLEIIDWSAYAQVFKDERVQAHYVPPIVIIDTWNGLEHKVQEISRESHRLEIYIRESEVESINRMISCDDILIDDITNGLNHVVDTSPGQLELAELERVADTSNHRVVLIYKTKKTIINKFDALNDQVELIGSNTYHSKYDKLSYDGELEEIRVQWGEGGEKLLQETNNVGFRVLLYLTDSEKETFKNDWNQNTFTIDAVDIVRKLPLEITELAENIHQVIVSCITVRQTIDVTAGLSNVVLLEMGPVTEHSKFKKLFSTHAPEQVKVRWSDSEDRLLRSINKRGYNILLYLNESDMDDFQVTYNGTSSIGVDSVTMEEKLPLEITQMISGYYQIIVPVIYSVLVGTVNLTPLNTHELVVTDSGTFTFHTDYAVIDRVDDTDNSDFNNGGGVEITGQSISRERKDIKLFLNTADKNSLKLHFERGTATIDAVTILQKEIISETELAYDLWEVDIKALVTTTVTNQL